MRAISLVVVLSIIAGSIGQQVEEIDEVSLLNLQVTTRIRKSVKEKPVMDASDHAKKESFCQALSANEPKSAGCSQTEPTVADAAGVGVEDSDEAVLDAVNMLVSPEALAVGSEDQPTFGVLGYFLDVLIILVFCDGLRRWNSKCKAQHESSEIAPATNAASPTADEHWAGLMTAALAGSLSQCETLLRTAAPLGRSDMFGCTVLHAAAKGGCAPLVKMLLERRAGSIDRRDAWDETPLHLAARAGNTDVCEVLLDYGARIDVVNAQDWTALVVAADANQEDVCNLLLARGATTEGLESDLPPLLRNLQARSVFERAETTDAGY